MLEACLHLKPCHLFIAVIFVEDLMSFIQILPERIYNPITAMGFLAMFTFQLDNTKM